MKNIYILSFGLILISLFLISNVDSAIPCTSDINCPDQGAMICQNKRISGYTCGLEGYCIEGKDIPVGCCSSSDCVADEVCDDHYKCVGGATTGGNLIENTKEEIKDGTNFGMYTLIIVIIGAIFLIALYIIRTTRGKK